MISREVECGKNVAKRSVAIMEVRVGLFVIMINGSLNELRTNYQHA